MKNIVKAIGLLAGLCVSVGASATTIDFSDQTASFTTPVANPLVYADARFTSAGGQRIFTFNGLLDRGLCPHATSACGSVLTIDFSTAVSGVGFNLYQVDEADSRLSVTATTATGTVSRVIALTRGFNVNRIDLGDLGDVTRLELDGTSDIEGVLYDNFVFEPSATSVPEPTSWAMMIAGFALAGTAARRRAHCLAIA